MLTDRGAASFASTDDSTVPIDQFLQQFNIFVVDIHRTRTFSINVQRVFPNGPRFCFRFAARGFSSHFRQLTGSLFKFISNKMGRNRDTNSVLSPAIMQIGRVTASRYFLRNEQITSRFGRYNVTEIQLQT